MIINKCQVFPILILLLLLVVISSCSKAPENPITVAVNSWLGYQPLFLATHLNYIDKNEIKILSLTSASEVMRNFRNNTIDVAALTLDEALTLIDDGFDIKIILVLDISNGADVMLGNKNITKLKNIKSKRIGVEQNALGSYMLTRALSLVSLTKSDVIVIPLEFSEHKSAFINNKVDVVITFEPVKTILQKNKANILFSSKDIPNEIIDVLVVQNEILEVKKQKVNKLVTTWFKTLNYMKTNKQESSRFLAQFSKLSLSEYKAAVSGIKFGDIDTNKKLLSNNKQGLVVISQKLIRILKKQNLIKTNISLSNVFLPEIDTK